MGKYDNNSIAYKRGNHHMPMVQHTYYDITDLRQEELEDIAVIALREMMKVSDDPSLEGALDLYGKLALDAADFCTNMNIIKKFGTLEADEDGPYQKYIHYKKKERDDVYSIFATISLNSDGKLRMVSSRYFINITAEIPKVYNIEAALRKEKILSIYRG